MRPETFRYRMAESLADLEELNGAIGGARALGDRRILAGMLALRGDILNYQDRVSDDYMGSEDAWRLGTKDRMKRWPGPDQSPASIWADMEFLITNYWERLREHDEIDPAFSVEAITLALLKRVAIDAQKFELGKKTILARDRAFWTSEREAKTSEVLEHARRLMEEHG